MALRYQPLEQQKQTMLAVEIAENKYKKDDKFYFEDQEKNILKLINSLYGYIRSKAYKYSKKINGANTGTQDELEQEAILAIYKALEKYDYKKCPQFFPYVQQWINAYMRTHQAKIKSMCKIETRSARKLLSKYGAIMDKSVEDQIKILGISRSEYDNITLALKPSKQLIKKASAEDTEETEEYLKADNPNPEQILIYKQLSEKIMSIKEEFAKELDDKQRDILENLISGTDSSFNLTEKYGVTRQRIQQIKDRIREKFRKRLEANGLNPKALFLIESGYDSAEH